MNTSQSFESSNVSSTQALVMEGFQQYMNALIENGAVEGRLGQQTILPELEPAFEIIHKVLAGAELEVSIKTLQEPDYEILSDFEDKRRIAEEKANRLNQDLGFLYLIP